MQRQVAVKTKQQSPGVIETIADGLSLAFAQPLLFLLPMLLDLYYWAGWKISASAVASPLQRWVLDSDLAGSGDVSEHVGNIGKADSTWLLSFFVPSLLGESPGEKLYELGSKPHYAPQHWWVALPILVLLIAASALLLSIFSVPIANFVVGRSRSIRSTLDAIAIAWLRIAGAILAIIGIAVLVLGPLLVTAGLLYAADIDAAPLLGLGFGLFVLAAMLTLWFVPEAIVVSEVGPFGAIKLSVAVVRANLCPTLGIIAASELINLGLGEIWIRISDTAPGLLLGVIANAFFGTGLAIASMIFFNSRIQILKPGSVRI